MHNITQVYQKFLSLAKISFNAEIKTNGNFRKYPNPPKMSDIEIIALSLAAEELGIDSENLLFQKLKNEYKLDFPQLIDRTNFNRRRRGLQQYFMDFCRINAEIIEKDNSTILIDSMPVPICRNGRAGKSKACREQLEVQPSFGYEAAHKSRFFGFKVHFICSQSGLPLDFSLMSAKVHDIKYLEHLDEDIVTDKEMIADKAYISNLLQLNLFEEFNLKIITPLRKNSVKKINGWSKEFAYKRRRIETVFSQLTQGYNGKDNKAKTLDGLVARIAAKFCTISTLMLNNFLNGNPLGQIRYSLYNQ